MMNDIRFYDTSSLLIGGESIFEQGQHFIISSITFKELENIKTSNKDPETKYSARLISRLLEQYQDHYDVAIHTQRNEIPISQFLEINDDTRILSDAIHYNNNVYIDEIIFVTNDLNLKHIANLFFGDLMIESIPENRDNYTGYIEITADNQQLAALYENDSINYFNLLIGQYLIVKDSDNKIVDIRVWTGENHRHLKYDTFTSNWFGRIEPLDPYQKLLFDSLSNNTITMVKGYPGSGKTFTSLAFLMSKLEHNDIDHIIIFCNTVATADAAKLGFYPGDRNSKLLDSQIGNLLISKLGGREGVEELIEREKLILLPFSDIRGYDTTGMQAGIYISEAQNLTRALMKLALQRIGSDCICIIDGDINGQVDAPQFQGNNNGMRRASKVFRGHDIYGEVTLNTIHRSKIAQIAEMI